MAADKGDGPQWQLHDVPLQKGWRVDNRCEYDVRSLTVFEYGLSNPFLPSQSTNHPGAYIGEVNEMATMVRYQYDASGRELRTVTEDIDGQKIYHDTDYDGLGRVSDRWETYYAGQERRFRARYRYDAWGNLRNPTTWSGSFTGTPRFDRGFTGHEYHRHFGLINMNGRMYDPVMSCFLSVDSYVQDPENPQNFNRYAYCLNNPLKYTDTDGEWQEQS